MKIKVDYKEEHNCQLNITSANYLSDYVIRINFSDGTETVVDFKPFLLQSQHPSIRKYLDEDKFSTFQVVDGNLNWSDYELIFPIEDLRNGTILKSSSDFENKATG